MDTRFLVVAIAALDIVSPTTTSALNAQPAATPLAAAHDNNAPVNIAADSVNYDTDGKSSTFTGNVVVVRADARTHADRVHVTTASGKADEIYASGNVVLDSPDSGTATGDSGVYSVVPRTVLLTGNVVVKKGNDVMRGSQATVDLSTGKSVLSGGVKVPGQTSPRVQAVIMPTQAK